MRKTTPLTPYSIVICALFLVASVHGQTVESAKRFIFKDADGKTDSAEVVTAFVPKKITHPVAKADSSINPKLMRAATIAEERAHAHSREQCWHYVKEALVASGAVSSYPKDPYKAPVGSVLVYNNKKGAGHVEIRTKHGFASDFRSKIPSPRPLIGVFTKG
jgi:hypothetical protein